ncbi:MAG: hypothetical protein FJZ01_19250, partial [Candidatus Sericytochromatia bacterium]|nr:hypothetical protein [Candidatus Tanganyikabacteria bacterium]
MKRIYVDPTAFLARAAAADFAPSEWHDLALLAHRLRRDGPTGELVCLSALPPPAPPAAHQLSGAVAIVESLGGRALLADDEGLDPVGTGALVVREWIARGRTRILIGTPPARLAPWRDALADLVGRAEVVLTGLHAALDLLAMGWDAVVIDAAHRLAGDPAALTRLAAAPPRLLLISATPVRSADLAAEPILTLLGARPGSDLRAVAVRRTQPPPVASARLAEIVRLEGAPAERNLIAEAREAASMAIAAGGAAVAGWCGL